MSQLIVIRHGQASFGEDNYDRLSPLGLEQARALGHYWAAHNICPEQVVVGPLRRHEQTWQATAEAMAGQGVRLPEPQFREDLDEHQGDQVFRHLLPELLEQDPEIRELVTTTDTRAPDASRRFMKAFVKVATRWANGELQVPEFESWQDFRARVTRATHELMAATEPRETVAVFASGGTVGAITGAALELADGKALEINYLVRNCAVNEYIISPRRFALSSFNNTAHLPDKRLHTYV